MDQRARGFAYFLLTLVVLIPACTKEINKSRNGGNFGGTENNTLTYSCSISPSSMPAHTTQTSHVFTAHCEETSSNGTKTLTARCFDNNLMIDADCSTITITGEGKHSIKVNAINSKGKTVPEAGPVTFTVDRQGPIMTLNTVGELGNQQRLVTLDLEARDEPYPNGVGVNEAKYYCAVSTTSGAGFFSQAITVTRQNEDTLDWHELNGDNYFTCFKGQTIRIPESYGEGEFYFQVMSHDLLDNRGPATEFPDGGLVITAPPVQAPTISLDSFKDDNDRNLNAFAPNLDKNSNLTNVIIPGVQDFPLQVDLGCDSNCSDIKEWRCSNVILPSGDPSAGTLCNGSSSSATLSTIIELNQISTSCNHILYVRAVTNANIVSNTVMLKYNADKTIPNVNSIKDTNNNESVYHLYLEQKCDNDNTKVCGYLDRLFYGATDLGCGVGMKMQCRISDPSDTGENIGWYDCQEKANNNCPNGDSSCSEFDFAFVDYLTGGDRKVDNGDKGLSTNLLFEFKACDHAGNCVTSSSAPDPSITIVDPCLTANSNSTYDGCESSFDNTAGPGNGTTIDPFDPYGPSSPYPGRN